MELAVKGCFNPDADSGGFRDDVLMSLLATAVLDHQWDLSGSGLSGPVREWVAHQAQVYGLVARTAMQCFERAALHPADEEAPDAGARIRVMTNHIEGL